MKLDAKLAANVGVLTAVSIVLTRFFGVIVPIAGANALRLSFGEAPIMLAGVLFGPAGGGLGGVGGGFGGVFVLFFWGALPSWVDLKHGPHRADSRAAAAQQAQ